MSANEKTFVSHRLSAVFVVNSFYKIYREQCYIFKGTHRISKRKGRSLIPTSTKVIESLARKLERIRRLNDLKECKTLEEFQALTKKYKHSVTELAAQAGISRYRLSREFAEYYGQTPIRYLNSVRPSHACTLLETTNLRVHEIASAVSIDSLTHFINLFKAKTGITPAAYRNGYLAFRETEHP